jgi:hypothetical protein
MQKSDITDFLIYQKTLEIITSSIRTVQSHMHILAYILNIICWDPDSSALGLRSPYF